jgi:stage II sporulation protein D
VHLKNINKVVFVFLIAIYSLNYNYFKASTNAKNQFQENPSFNIRVLLHEKNSKEQNIFEIESNFEIIVSAKQLDKKPLLKTKKFKIITQKDSIFITKNDENIIKKIKFDEIKFTPKQNGYLILNKQPFQGSLTFKIDKDKHKLLLINTLDLEDYLYSVLISESYPAWPTEMQKVQAIASRSYAVSCIMSARKGKNPLPYDLKRTNFHQKYNGLHQFTHLRQAIDETKNIIMTYNNEVVLAMFDACCGGIIPAHMKSLNFKQAPYLARKKQCTFCNGYELFRWHEEFSLQSLSNRLMANPQIAPKLKNAGKLIDVGILEKDKAGIVKRVKIFCSKRNFVVKSTDFWSTLRDKIKSLDFSLKKKHKNIIIEGRGYGHQTGLCQRGAKELIDRGWDFKKVLHFYYPKIKFASLKKYAKV